MELVKKVDDDALLPFVGYCRAFVVDSDGLQRKTKGQTPGQRVVGQCAVLSLAHTTT